MEGVVRPPYGSPRRPVPYAGGAPRPFSPHWDARCVAADMQRTGDYIQNFTRARFRALIAQVNPALTPRIMKAGTRDAAVQAAPWREASVQCSLGTRTLTALHALDAAQRPRNVADTRSTGARSAQQPPSLSTSSSKPNRANPRLPQPRGLSLYSPVSFGWPRVTDKIAEAGANPCAESGGHRALNRTFVKRAPPETVAGAAESPAPGAPVDEPRATLATETRSLESSAPVEIVSAKDAAPSSPDALGWQAPLSGSTEEAAAATNWPLGEVGRGLWEPGTAKEQRRAGARAARGSHTAKKGGGSLPEDHAEAAAAGGSAASEPRKVTGGAAERRSRPGPPRVARVVAAARPRPARDVFVDRMTESCGRPGSEIYAGSPLMPGAPREPAALLHPCPGDYMEPGDYKDPPCVTLFAKEDEEDSLVEAMGESASLETEVSGCVGEEPRLDAELGGSAVERPLLCGLAAGDGCGPPVEDATAEFGEFPEATL